MDDLQNLVGNTINAASSLEGQITTSAFHSSKSQKAAESELLQQLRLLSQGLDSLGSPACSARQVNRTLNRLKFDKILSRESEIPIAGDQTFE